jgi:enoyl-CoA hydratase/carnithine racemase
MGIHVAIAVALRAGLVSRVVDDEQVKYIALEVAEKIATMSRSVVALGKSFFYAQVQLPILDAYRYGC